MRSDIIPKDSLFEPQQDGNLNPMEKFLGTVIVKLTNGHYMVKQADGSWLELKDAPTACQKANALWVGMHSFGGIPVAVTSDAVLKFLLDGQRGALAKVPLVSGTMMVPTCEGRLAVQYRGHRFINTWHNTLMLGDEAAMNSREVREDLEAMLRMIREGLCGQEDQRTWGEMMTMLHGRDPAEGVFRYTMCWLAAGFQQPGINLPTVLWQLGHVEGMGRGSLQTTMQRLYGGDLVHTANFTEFNRGWTDQMCDKLLICMNEVGEHAPRPGDMDVAAFCKQYTCESEITLAQRYHGIGSGPVPNFVNYVGTGNKLRPMRRVDESDRRHEFHATSTDPAKKVYSQRTWELLNNGDPARCEAMLQAFAFTLRSLTVDMDLLRKPLDTPLRRLNISASEADENYWLANDDRYLLDEWHRAAYWQARYNEFHPEQERPTSARAMGVKMQTLHASGHVEQRVVPRGKRASYEWRVSSEKYPRYEDAPETGRKAERKAQQGHLLYLRHESPASPTPG